MKKYLITLSLLFIGCSEKTTSFSKINQQKRDSTHRILSKLKDRINYDNPEYQHKIKLVQNILYKINTHLYDYPYEVKAKFVKTKYGMATALADDTILFTTHFLDAVRDYFTKDEVVALICHESVHILNDDWGKNFRDNSTYIDYKIQGKIETPNLIGVAVGYGLTRLLYPGKSNMKFKEYISVEGTQQISTYEDKDTLSKGDFNFNLLSIQNFSIETEMNTDAEALSCLRALNIDSKNMISVLQKIARLEKDENNQIENRIKKLGEIK